MYLDKILSGTVADDDRSQNPSDLSDQENMDPTGNVTRGTKEKLPDEQPSFERARKVDNEFCEPANKAKRKSSAQPAITNKSKTAEVDKLPDVLLQLLRPDRKTDGLLSDSDQCKTETQRQLPDTSSSTGFVVTTFMSLVLESLFYTVYREDEERDIPLSIAHSQKMESDMGRVSTELSTEQDTNAEWTEQKTNVSTERVAAEVLCSSQLPS